MAEVWLRAPAGYLFEFPPSPEPRVLPAPQQDPSFAQPFTIDPELYNAALDVRVPLTIASVYAVTVTLLNAINRQRQHKPWSISKTRAFFVFVVAHNVFLAVYSAWTFAGMVNAIREIWPGWSGAESLPEVVDAFCQIQGPRGFGDAVLYDSTSSQWASGNLAIKLLDSKPDPTDVGRLWNGGLAFYGWLFYLSKFYEVIDTLVILAKGKRSSFLQTYHHAGAMLCMWAGIRYMSPPIWMFCLVNSGIHALMYTYYTISAFRIRVPGILKKTLTTMQITQFLIGFTYAIMHLFVAYKIPIQSPYVFYHNLSTALPSATSAIASAAASADVGSWLKKAILRAAGDEGLSANIRNRNGNLFGHSGEQAVLAESGVLNKAKEEIRYRLEYVGVSCIQTSGQAFAIYLNLLYLFPLTMLFVRFFIKSYLRAPAGGKSKSQAQRFGQSGFDAARGVEKEVVKAMRRDRGSALTSPTHSDAEVSSPTSPSRKHKNKFSMTKIVDSISDTASDLASKGVNGVKQASEKVTKSDMVAAGKDTASKASESVKDTANATVEKAQSKANDIESALRQASEDKLGDVKKDEVKKDEAKKDEVKKEEVTEAVKSPSKKKRKNKNKHHNKQQEAHSHEEVRSDGEAPEEHEHEHEHHHEDEDLVNETKPAENGQPAGAPDPAAQAYETSIDGILTEEQKEAEEEMQSGPPPAA